MFSPVWLAYHYEHSCHSHNSLYWFRYSEDITQSEKVWCSILWGLCECFVHVCVSERLIIKVNWSPTFCWSPRKLGRWPEWLRKELCARVCEHMCKKSIARVTRWSETQQSRGALDRPLLVRQHMVGPDSQARKEPSCFLATAQKSRYSYCLDI